MADESSETLTCGNCRRTSGFSTPVSVIVVFAPGLERPYPLIPSEDYHVCTRCDAVFGLIDRAVEGHAVTSQAGPWTRAIVIFTDGDGLDVAARRDDTRATQKMALA
jgi:hypothetical protein